MPCYDDILANSFTFNYKGMTILLYYSPAELFIRARMQTCRQIVLINDVRE